MKLLFLSLILLLTGYRENQALPGNEGEAVPQLNRQVLEFVKKNLNKKVGRGECWDLAAQALDKNQARWDHRYKYGREVNPKKEVVFPGDIIQFEGVVVKYRQGNTVFQETMQHHTAIVWEVKDNGVFVIAHQNNGFSGKKVGLSELDLTSVVRGKLLFYRPVE